MGKILGIDLYLSFPRALYDHGWVVGWETARKIKYYWNLTIFEVQGLLFAISFDLVEDSSPLIVGLDVESYGNTSNMHEGRGIEFNRSQDNKKKNLFTCIAKDTSDNVRLWLDIGRYKNSCVKALTRNIKMQQEINLAKNVHRCTHGSKHELENTFIEAGKWPKRWRKP